MSVDDPLNYPHQLGDLFAKKIKKKKKKKATKKKKKKSREEKKKTKDPERNESSAGKKFSKLNPIT